MKGSSKLGLSLTGLLVLCFLVPAPAEAQTQPSLNVTYTINLDQNYKIYGYLTEHLTVGVSGTLNPSGSPTRVIVTFPFGYSDVVGLPHGANFSLKGSPLGGGTYTDLTVEIPENSTSFSFTLEGTQSGLSSFFFRNIGSIPPVYVASNAPPFLPTVTVLVPDSSIQIQTVYPSNSGQFVSIAGQSYLEVNPQDVTSAARGVTLVYQSPLSGYFAFVAIVVLAGIALIVPALVRRFKAPTKNLWFRVPVALRSFAEFVSRRRGPRTLLVIFVFLCLTLISLSTIFGPPPQPRAYLAAT
ncbi:MAG: hypothetical protein OK452_07100, partial [Thaumarchaeota archaeon]|nr:hypothetical protein [Nitrososphaerota archaeon]